MLMVVPVPVAFVIDMSMLESFPLVAIPSTVFGPRFFDVAFIVMSTVPGAELGPPLPLGIACADATSMYLMEPECAANPANLLDKMDHVTIKARESGPYLVTGTVTLIDADGTPYATTENFVLCRCGHSQTKPFCDGSHKTTGFVATERAPQPEVQP